MSNTANRLRAICADIRRKPYSLKELIPLMQIAADELEQRKPPPELHPIYLASDGRFYDIPQRQKPLTEDEIDGLAINYDGLPNSFLELARAIEKAHGIGGEHD
jgi:hypothetical protein